MVFHRGNAIYIKDLKPYWSFSDELSLENGMILKGEQIVVPARLQQQYLDVLHIRESPDVSSAPNQQSIGQESMSKSSAW